MELIITASFDDEDSRVDVTVSRFVKFSAL